MPCDCDEEREVETVKLRFIGGRRKRGRLRGPYRSYETGKIYEMPIRYANKEAYPYWEAVTEEEAEAASIEEKIEEETITESEGLSEFNPSLTEEDLFKTMDVNGLRFYIQSSGMKVDKRWGRKRLIEEAKKIL